jgi:uncharacterized OB-fold protein
VSGADQATATDSGGAPARPSSGPRFDQPLIEDESAPFWDGLKDGKLLIKRCTSCGAFHYYPRPFCPTCWSDEVEWYEASGKARVYSYSTVYVNDLPPFGPEVPYVAAVVELEEGPRMMTRLVDCTKDTITIDMPVEVAYQRLDDELQMAVFRPA